jgi:hypothetical protein
MSEEWVSVAEAARRLSISPRAVRKRCAMGNQRFRKRGNRLEVQWEPNGNREEPEWEPTEPFAEPAGTETGTRGTDGEPKLEPEEPALVAQLRSEVAFLRSQLAQRDVAEAELRRLMLADKQELHELRQRLALPPALAPEEASPVEGDEHNGHRGRSWWTRLFGRKEKS